MNVTGRFARRFRLLKLLRAALGLGGAFNLGMALLLVAAPGRLGEPLAAPLVAQPALAWLLAALLVPLAGLYLLAAKDPRRYAGVMVMLVGGRLLGSAALGAGALGQPEAAGLWVFAGVDLAFALVIALAWLPLRV
ncbi:MAG TPA: hypothetical protein VMR44_04170 [Thermoanaerobaculia bacterium]|nr:hypothetical protein [Thermoanaerobaculia bacterium]